VGRIEVLPGKKAVLSSRIQGRAFSVLALPDMRCEQGDELVWVESRQPGDPPPTIRLDAPIAGLISKVNIAQGQPIEPSDALVEIVDLSTVEAAAAVPEHLAGKLKKGQKARIKVAAFPDKEIEAELVHLGATADESSGTLEAAFHIPNEDELLRPGMRAEFSIITSTRDDVTTVPREAVLGDSGARYVMIKHYDLAHAFWKVPVSTGAANDKVIEITGGLNSGDEVVTKAAYSVAFAGRAVSLKEALDAAHGHPHNEDGSEMTKEQQEAAANAAGHGHSHEHEGSAMLWKISTGVLAALLLIQAMMKKPAGKEAQ
jgi:membrane fusion protein, heavy metal efflux system